MQKTTAQSQQESQKTRARLVLFWKPFYKKKNMRAFDVARPRQRNIYQIRSPTTCNLHAYRQGSELRFNSFFISTTLLLFEKLIILMCVLRHPIAIRCWANFLSRHQSRLFLGANTMVSQTSGKKTQIKISGSRWIRSWIAWMFQFLLPLCCMKYLNKWEKTIDGHLYILIDPDS